MPNLSPYYQQYLQRFARDPLLILPGFGAVTVQIGWTVSQVESQIGPCDQLTSHENGLWASYFRLGATIQYQTIGDVTKVAAINLQGPNHEGFSPYKGATPEGISLDSDPNDIIRLWGHGTVVIPRWNDLFPLEMISYPCWLGLDVWYSVAKGVPGPGYWIGGIDRLTVIAPNQD